MNLDGNEGREKYGLVSASRLTEVSGIDAKAAASAIALLERLGVLDWGQAGTESEFFVIKLRDENAPNALMAYSTEVERTDRKFAAEVGQLAMRAGRNNQFCKTQD